MTDFQHNLSALVSKELCGDAEAKGALDERPIMASVLITASIAFTWLAMRRLATLGGSDA